MMADSARFLVLPSHGEPLDNDVILNPGEVIDDKYEIISKIGQSAIGVVYKARARAHNRSVAIRMLTHVDEATRQHFSAEAKNLARFEHPAVMRIDAFGSSGKWGHYLVFAYVPGRDLDAAVPTALPVEEAVSLTLAICSGVSACHVRSIVHRDLKPSNIRVTNETSWLERVKILDFGLALPFDSPIIKAHQTHTSQSGSADDVSRYVAPELLRHEAPTKHCDQYSIAALLYLMLTGHPPFETFAGDALVRAIVLGQCLPPRVLRPDLPAGLEAAVLRGLDPNPLRRFRSVNALALTILPFGPPHLRAKSTRHFTDASGSLNHRLIEPVSAYRPDRSETGLSQRGDKTPAVVPTSHSEPSPPLPRAVEPLSAATPLPEPMPSDAPAPSQETQQRRLGSRWRDPNAVVLFSLGAALGSVIATIIFAAFFWYRQRHPEPCVPTVPPAAVEVLPPSSHAAQ
jgi:eukaryotic-like serine/threonine-protein kinase